MMSEFDYDDIKYDLEMLAQDKDDEGHRGSGKRFRHYIAAIEALQAEAELGAKIEKLTARGYMVVFASPLDLEEQHRYGGDLNCRIMRSMFEGQGDGDTPLQALNNAIDALGEMTE